MKGDCLAKRGKFIGKVHSLLQEFGYVDSAVMVRILTIYVTSFYGSNLWDLYSTEVTKLFSSWNVTIRNVFGLPWTTHRFFIESLSGTSHPKTLLCTRIVKFWEMHRGGRKSSVRYLANLVYNDRRTLTGKTVTNIANDCNIERSKLNRVTVRNVRYFPPIPGDEWKVKLLKELLDIRDGRAVVPGVSYNEIKAMIDEICCN